MNPESARSALPTLLAALGGACLALLAVAWFGTRYLPQLSVSDLRFRLSTTPLGADEVQGRMRARLYTADFAARVEQTADRITAQTTDPQVKHAALRWKLGALEAATQAGLRPSAQLALIDAWALSLQMQAFTDSDAGRLAFGSQQPLARATARALASEGEALAVDRLEPAALAVLRPMVMGYVQRTPIIEPSMQRASIAMDWMRAASVLGDVPVSTGSAADMAGQALALADTHLRQLPRALRWRGEVSLLDNQERLSALGQVVDDTLQEAKRDGEFKLRASTILAAGERLARITGWSWLKPLSSWIVDVLKWIALFTLITIALGVGVGWWVWGRALARERANPVNLVSPSRVRPGTVPPSRS
jgi:hypothetical protein